MVKVTIVVVRMNDWCLYIMHIISWILLRLEQGLVNAQKPMQKPYILRNGAFKHDDLYQLLCDYPQPTNQPNKHKLHYFTKLILISFCQNRSRDYNNYCDKNLIMYALIQRLKKKSPKFKLETLKSSLQTLSYPTQAE